MRGIKQEDFSKFLKESYLSVWVDNESGFGTYPIESMITGTPVIGKLPNMKPEWISENNGIWTSHFNDIVDIISNFTQNWLEDNISEELYNNMYVTGEKYQNKEKYTEEVVSLFADYFNKRKENFEQQLEKLKLTEEKI
jgi:glycosyltransferase involved in cell wall biosynthesis